MPLKTLDEFNASQMARFESLNTLKPNGIACPVCGSECVESAVVATSLIQPLTPHQPAHWRMQCSGCTWNGSRVCA